HLHSFPTRRSSDLISLDRIRRRHFALGMQAAEAVHGQGIARLRRLQVVRRGPVWISRNVAALGVHGGEPEPAALAGVLVPVHRLLGIALGADSDSVEVSNAGGGTLIAFFGSAV